MFRYIYHFGYFDRNWTKSFNNIKEKYQHFINHKAVVYFILFYFILRSCFDYIVHKNMSLP